MPRWQDNVQKAGNSFEQDVDTMLKGLGYVPIKIYQRKGLPVKDPLGKIERLYPDTFVQVELPRPITQTLMPAISVIPRSIVHKVVLANGWYWHNKTSDDDRERNRKNELYVAAGFYVVCISDHWFKSEAKKAEVKPLLDAAMKSTKKVEDYLAT